MNWNDLLKTAVIGTDRASLKPVVLEELEKLGIPTKGKSPPELLLEAVALQWNRERAGMRLPKLGGELPAADDAGEETSFYEGYFLQMIVKGEFAPALKEYLQLLKKGGRALPPEHLPALITWGLESPSSWEVIEPLIGGRGRWLINQHPEWGDLLERLKREATTQPDLEWERQLEEALRQIVLMKNKDAGKVKLEINRKKIPEWLSALGLQKAGKKKRLAEDALLPLIRRAAPAFWERYFELPPAKALQLFVRSDLAEELLLALAEAVVLHEDSQWAAALTGFYLDNHFKARWKKLNLSLVFPELEEAAFRELALRSLRESPPLTNKEMPAAQLLNACDHPWDKALAQAFFSNFYEWLTGTPSLNWHSWVYKALIKKAAYVCPLEMQQPLKYQFGNIPFEDWNNIFDEFFRVLEFRKLMTKMIV